MYISMSYSISEKLSVRIFLSCCYDTRMKEELCDWLAGCRRCKGDERRDVCLGDKRMGSNASQLQHEGEDGGGLAKQSLGFAGERDDIYLQAREVRPFCLLHGNGRHVCLLHRTHSPCPISLHPLFPSSSLTFSLCLNWISQKTPRGEERRRGHTRRIYGSVGVMDGWNRFSCPTLSKTFPYVRHFTPRTAFKLALPSRQKRERW